MPWTANMPHPHFRMPHLHMSNLPDHMFSERESGEAKSWSLIIVIIVLTMILNIGIIIVFRVLLDSEDEINEPVIQGETREKMAAFLGVFTMTFFFGCWCCFCCGGLFCKLIWYCPGYCCGCMDDVSEKITKIHKIQRRNTETIDLEDQMEDVVLAARGIPQGPAMQRTPSDFRPYERPPCIDQVFALEAIDERPERPTTLPSQTRRGRAYSIDVSFQ